MKAMLAYAKINLTLLVGTVLADGKHELATVYQRIALADRIELEPAETLEVKGFPADTLVRSALQALAERAGVEPRWRASIDKKIPPATGLAGGSSDAAAALELANATLAEPLPLSELAMIAASLGADVPLFLAPGPQLGTGNGTALRSLELPLDYSVVLVLPVGATKSSTADVYRAFDERRGEIGFDERRSRLLSALAEVRESADLALLPPNDLATSPLCRRLSDLGAFRADVTGAGPMLYGLFERDELAEKAARLLAEIGEVWLTKPAW